MTEESESSRGTRECGRAPGDIRPGSDLMRPVPAWRLDVKGRDLEGQLTSTHEETNLERAGVSPSRRAGAVASAVAWRDAIAGCDEMTFFGRELLPMIRAREPASRRSEGGR
jgi:hypothetical protein